MAKILHTANTIRAHVSEYFNMLIQIDKTVLFTTFPDSLFSRALIFAARCSNYIFVILKSKKMSCTTVMDNNPWPVTL